jgi:hypothetical protein
LPRANPDSRSPIPEPSHCRARGYSSTIKESPFQSRVIQCARLNGWRIDLEGLNSQLQANTHKHLCRLFRRLATVRDFLFARKKGPVFTLVHHAFDSRKSAPGFPDLVLSTPETAGSSSQSSNATTSTQRQNNAYGWQDSWQLQKRCPTST